MVGGVLTIAFYVLGLGSEMSARAESEEMVTDAWRRGVRSSHRSVVWATPGAVAAPPADATKLASGLRYKVLEPGAGNERHEPQAIR